MARHVDSVAGFADMKESNMETNDDLAPGWALDRKANPFKWPRRRTMVICLVLAGSGLAFNLVSFFGLI